MANSTGVTVSPNERVRVLLVERPPTPSGSDTASLLREAGYEVSEWHVLSVQHLHSCS